MSKFIESANPPIALHPSELPQQKLTLVREVPEFPKDWLFTFDDHQGDLIKAQGSSEFLCSLEWAWSPMHDRLQSWVATKSKCGEFILLTTGFFNEDALYGLCDENGNPVDADAEPWIFQEIGFCKVHPHLSFKDHALLCLIESLREEISYSEIDEYHWINSQGLLSCSDIAAVARVVWADVQESDDDDE